jgi:gas vesicle protein
MNFFNKFIAGLVVGAAAGAAAAWFFQTEEGKKVWSDIKNKAGAAGDNLKDNLKNFEGEMNDLLKKGKKFVDDLEQKARDAASSI